MESVFRLYLFKGTFARILTVLSFALVIDYALTQEEGVSVGNFQYLERLDPIDDTDNSLIIVEDDSSSYRKSAVIWRCTGEELEVYVIPEAYMGSEDYYTITYRFGKNEAVTSRWGSSTNGDAAFLDNDKEVAFSQEAESTNSLVIRVSDYENTEFTYLFDVTGFSEAIAKLGCNPLQKAQ